MVFASGPGEMMPKDKRGNVVYAPWNVSSRQKVA